MSFLTFALYGSLLVSAGFAILYCTTRLFLTFSPEEALPYRILQFIKWVRDGKLDNKQVEQQVQDKIHPWSALALGVGVVIVFTFMPLYTDFLQRFVWSHLPELTSAILFVVFVLIPLKSNKHRLIVGLCMLGTTVAVELAPSWLTINLAVAVGVFASYVLYSTRTSFVRAAIVLWVVAWLYDAVQVWITQSMQEKIAQSIRLGSPTNLMIPTSFDLSAPTIMTLGFGDLFLPGILVIVAGRIGQRTNNQWFYRAALLGYAAGFLVAMLAAYIFSSSQPGLVYMVSGVTIATYLAARRARLVEELKIKISSSHTTTTKSATTES